MKDKIQSAFAQVRAEKDLIDSTASYLHNQTHRRKKGKRIFTRVAGTFASAAVLVAGFFVYNLYYVGDAYVSIDVNPSVELTLNRLDKVIASRAFNEDGERVLRDVSLRGKRYDAAVALVIGSMEEDGYFEDGGLVSVTVQVTNGERQQLLCSALQRFIRAGGTPSVPAEAQVEVFPVSAEVWSDARGCNMSPAKYLAILALMEIDEDATIEAYSDSTIRQIRQRVQECRGEEEGGGNYEHDSGGEHGYGHGYRGGH